MSLNLAPFPTYSDLFAKNHDLLNTPPVTDAHEDSVGISERGLVVRKLNWPCYNAVKEFCFDQIQCRNKRADRQADKTSCNSTVCIINLWEHAAMQESLANAKVSARQQCVYKGMPSREEIYDKSTQGT